MISEKDLQLTLKAYAANQIGDETILHVFYKLAEEIFAAKVYHNRTKRIKDKPKVLREAAEYCLAKADRYDKDKAKAFNFFTTIIGCYLGQVNGMLRSLEKFKHDRDQRQSTAKGNKGSSMGQVTS